MTEERYIIKTGKFGCYFYDTGTEKDITLEEVRDMLNDLEALRSFRDLLNYND